MNVFPVRNEGGNIFYREYEKKFVKNNHLKNNESIVSFPDGENLNKYNDMFMKNFLSIDLNVKKKKNKHQKIQERKEKIKSTTFHDLNIKTTVKGNNYSIFCYIVDITKSLEENYTIIEKGGFKTVNQFLDDSDMEYYDDEQLIGNKDYKEVLNAMYKNILQFEIPSDSSFWMFGKNHSIVIQSTFIPPETSEDESELLLISNIIEKTYFDIDKNEIYDDFMDNKDNNKLIFILLK